MKQMAVVATLKPEAALFSTGLGEVLAAAAGVEVTAGLITETMLEEGLMEAEATGAGAEVAEAMAETKD